MKTWRISALGRAFGLSRSTLLHYDREGLLRASGRSPAGYRVFNEADHDRLARICVLREAGLGLAEIRQLLACETDGSRVLEQRLDAIGQEMATLRAQQRLITGMLKTVSAGREPAGLNRTLWLTLQTACGLDEAALKRWHATFEREAPEAHHAFLIQLGLSEKEALQVRMLTRNLTHNTTQMSYFYELFESLPRQGPGSDAATLQALSMIGKLPEAPCILDIGCGVGRQTRVLARTLRMPVLAIDNHQAVLQTLASAAAAEGLPIETRELSMIDMPFAPASFDLLWAEGAIFIIGLEKGLAEFGRLLKPGGYLAFSEMCQFTEAMPPALKEWVGTVYPDMKKPEAIEALATACGYRVVGRFNLPSSAWWDEYYTPMLERMADLRVEHVGVPEAEAIYSACETEAAMHRQYAHAYGYTFFVVQKT